MRKTHGIASPAHVRRHSSGSKSKTTTRQKRAPAYSARTSPDIRSEISTDIFELTVPLTRLKRSGSAAHDTPARQLRLKKSQLQQISLRNNESNRPPSPTPLRLLGVGAGTHRKIRKKEGYPHARQIEPWHYAMQMPRVRTSRTTRRAYTLPPTITSPHASAAPGQKERVQRLQRKQHR
jgi:hypothetical protein